MTGKEDVRLLGRHPEFSRQSRKPGIGVPALEAIAALILKYCPADQLIDVPQSVAQGHSPMPLGRLMRRKLRGLLSLPEGASDEVLREAWYEQVLPVLQMAKASSETISLREAFRRQNAPYEQKLKFRASIYERGRI